MSKLSFYVYRYSFLRFCKEKTTVAKIDFGTQANVDDFKNFSTSFDLFTDMKFLSAKTSQDVSRHTLQINLSKQKFNSSNEELTEMVQTLNGFCKASRIGSKIFVQREQTILV